MTIEEMRHILQDYCVCHLCSECPLCEIDGKECGGEEELDETVKEHYEMVRNMVFASMKQTNQKSFNASTEDIDTMIIIKSQKKN